MSSWLGSPELKVGVLVVVVSALIGVMAMKVAEGPGLFSGSRTYYFVADSAGGLIRNSAVKMAGIKVGVISDIKLVDGKAQIYISVDRDTQLTQTSHVEMKSDGILGDKHVELVPGGSGDPALEVGQEIPLKAGGAGMDEVMADVSRVAKSMNELMETLNAAAKDGNEGTSIGRIVKNIEVVTADLRQVTSQNKEKIGEIVDRVRNLTKNLDTYINEDTLARVDRSVKNIEEITHKINSGEGTLGRLINDEQTVEELNSAIANVNKFLGGADKMETSVDFHSEFLTESSQSKSVLGLKIQPGLDRYYEIQLIDDPEGTSRSTTTEASTNGGPTNTTETTTTYHNKMKFTGIFAKNFWDLTVKGGIIENSGGVGFDYFFFNKSLRLSTELFDFQDLQWRAFVRYNFFKGVYVIAGGDDLLSNSGQASAFVGAGIFITNDDLKLLASKMSFQ